jgi:hypothetical protein
MRRFRKHRPILDPALQRRIGEQLRAMYQEGLAIFPSGISLYCNNLTGRKAPSRSELRRRFTAVMTNDKKAQDTKLTRV